MWVVFSSTWMMHLFTWKTVTSWDDATLLQFIHSTLSFALLFISFISFSTEIYDSCVLLVHDQNSHSHLSDAGFPLSATSKTVGLGSAACSGILNTTKRALLRNEGCPLLFISFIKEKKKRSREDLHRSTLLETFYLKYFKHF